MKGCADSGTHDMLLLMRVVKRKMKSDDEKKGRVGMAVMLDLRMLSMASLHLVIIKEMKN